MYGTLTQPGTPWPPGLVGQVGDKGGERLSDPGTEREAGRLAEEPEGVQGPDAQEIVDDAELRTAMRRTQQYLDAMPSQK